MYTGMMIAGLLGLLIAVLGAYMTIKGRGISWIAGFNTMSAEEKSKYDIKALCKSAGKFLIMLGIVTVLLGVGTTFGVIYDMMWFWVSFIAFMVVVTGGSLYLVIFMKAGERFRK